MKIGVGGFKFDIDYKCITIICMKRHILQIPIDPDLRKKAEKEATDFGFSSLQEMIRVMLAQMIKKNDRCELKIDNVCEKYGINYLGLFGSMARGEETPKSDVDLLVKFKKNSKLGLFELENLREELEHKFGKKVDLVTKLNKYIKPYAEKDLKTIYEKK